MKKSKSGHVMVALAVSALLICVVLLLLYLQTGGSFSFQNHHLLLLTFPALLLSGALLLEKKHRQHTESIENTLEQERNTIAGARNYLNEIAAGKLGIEIREEKTQGSIFDAIEKLRNSLSQAKDKEMQRLGEDERRKWASEGLAQFGDILRQTCNDLNEYSYSIIRYIVSYLDANQGGIFILNDEDETVLDLKACYAFDRKKFMEKKIHVGEGIVGMCFLERETTYITNLPQDYINITSGLGGGNPTSLLIVPLKLNEEVLGVMEIASFQPFLKHQIEFVEKIAESIASSISGVKTNLRTARLLQQSQEQTEHMHAQEEEMRQNLEEMQSVQENLLLKEEKLKTAALELEFVEKKLVANIDKITREQ